jgi:hypothetical protein
MNARLSHAGVLPPTPAGYQAPVRPARERLALVGIVLLSVVVTAQRPIHLEVSDPSGDAVAAPGTLPPKAPDLIAAIADVAAGTLTLTVRFAPGTFDRRTMGVFVQLDTDNNPLTPRGGRGYEYFIGSNTGGIMKYNAGDRTTETADVTFLNDALRITVSLKRLGSRDGNLSFRVEAYTRATASSGAIQSIVDVMPDGGLPAARLQ